MPLTGMTLLNLIDEILSERNHDTSDPELGPGHHGDGTGMGSNRIVRAMASHAPGYRHMPKRGLELFANVHRVISALRQLPNGCTLTGRQT